MTESISYFEIVTEVGESWDKVKRIPTWEELLGYTLFEKMFEASSDKWGMFPFTQEDFEKKDAKFMAFAKQFVRMLDMAVHLLGPDMEIVEEQMSDLGSMHDRYGVKKEHYELMGQALEQTLQRILGKRSFTDTTKESWQFIYKFMSDAMLKGAETK